MSSLRLTLPLLLLAGCPYLGDSGYTDKVRDVDGDGLIAERFGGPDCDDTDPNMGDCDADQDGVRSVEAGGEDCDDRDATVYPGAPELCDGADHDCDGLVGNDDDDVTDNAPFVYPDDDDDGFGRDSGAIRWCGTPPDGYVTELELGDCDDADVNKHPGADERCDATDWDCDGDPTAGAIDAVGWWGDADGDGYGDGEVLAVQCNPPTSDAVVQGLLDCAPDDPTVHPQADDIPYDGIDQNCDGADLDDIDGDGFRGGPQGVDCDDTSSDVSPAQVETCNGIDDDCDGAVDDGVILTYYPDYDSDGHGDPTGLAVQACAPPAQHVALATDCDDTTDERAPGNTEVCDGIDNDCDGDIDTTAIDLVVRFPDEDADTFGDPDGRWEGCLADVPAGTWLEDDQDCDDTNERVFPGASEVCDLLDNDCNGMVDDDADDAVLAYVDNDDDRFGDPLSPVMRCTIDEGFSTLPTDCDDDDRETYPGAPEICYDGKRQDCSAAAVDDCDADGTVDAQDCAPEDPARSLTALEICDGIDNDCDGDVDSDDDDVDPTTAQQYYLDADGDGITGGVQVGAVQCDPPASGVALTDELDCDDDDADRYPFADERCDEVDNDCDGAVDEEAVDPFPWYDDLDSDGFGALASDPVLYQCDDPGLGYAPTADDCVDGQPGVNPGALELCDGIDNDCDGLVDDLDDDTQLLPWFLDADGDGVGTGAVVLACSPPVDHVAASGDCDDTDPERRPGTVELCDGIDNDCDGLTDFDDPDIDDTIQWLPDADGDGVVTWTPDDDDPTQPLDLDDDGLWDEAVVSCTQPPGRDLPSRDGDSLLNDCDDDDGTVFPGALEVCDGIDNDCVDGVDSGALLIGPVWFADADDDGWGDPQSSTRACEQPDDHVVLAGDCDDDPDAGGSAVFPGAIEDCTDGYDNDCDGLVDDADLDAGETIWYYDADGDGYGDPVTASDPQCSPPDAPPAPGDWVRDGGDCDDTRIDIGPGRVELCDGVDNDCNGDVDDEDTGVEAPIRFVDDDGDGYGSEPVLACAAGDGVVDEPGDCDDADPTVNPAAAEVCTDAGQPVDENCDGLVDQDLAPVYLDSDGDGFGDASEPRASCATGQSLTWVTDATDCDDADGDVNPDAVEICNVGAQIDDDCDGVVSLADPDLDISTLTSWVPDLDRDGHYATGSTVQACVAPSTSWDADDGTLAIDDCDDLAANRYPGAPEICDTVDNDCNGTPDDIAPSARYRWFPDDDDDGYALDGATAVFLCDADPPGFARVRGDCDDAAASIHPGADEVCDGEDNDCDGLFDAADGSLSDGLDGFFDVDMDLHGDPARPTRYCAIQPMGYAQVGDDCDDLNSDRYPGNEEACDDVDNDCSGVADDNLVSDGVDYVPDRDGDGVYDLSEVVRACDDPDSESQGWRNIAIVSGADDCNDQDPRVYEGADEVCDGIRNDCTAAAPDEDPTDGVAYYPDTDGDLFGDPLGSPLYACSPPADHVLDNTDCDDSSINIRPGLPFEVCGNSDDENCDGVLDDLGDATVLLSDGTLDHTDYWVLATNDLVNIDDDGDGYIDVQYLRSDLERRFSCDPLAVPWFDARDFGDCDDGNGAVHPYADEICDDLDNDCDGAVDADDGNVMFQGSSVDVHLDLDRDGARSNQIVDEVCPDATVPVGFVLFDGAVDVDCDDGDAERSPLLSEVCDGIDNNCDPTDDFLEDDTDGDGFLACDPSECDDNDDASNGETLWFYPDEDADGYVGAFTDVVASCTQPPDSPLPWARELGDCDDTLASFSPGATEVCDGLDNDCDGQVPPEESDNDGDGEGACTDCDDSDPQRSNLFAELCDGIDTDCDGFIDPDLEVDDDGDNFVECDDWVGDIAGIDGGDCNDSAAILFPGQSVYVTTGFGNPDFTDIQTAIDTVCDDAFIAVEDGEGTFSEFVLPSDKVVHIAGIGPFPIRIVGGSTTAILADGTPPGTTIENLEPETDDGYGLVVTNGAVLDAIDIEVDQFSGAYQGMSVSNGSDVQCTNCVFEDTTASSGSAVLVDGSTVALYDSEITGSTNTDNGAVHAINGSSLTIENTSFTDNAISGTNVKSSGITVSGGQMVLKQTTFHDHTADDRQPTVLVNLGADASFEDVKLVDNAGGIWVETNGTVDFTRLTMLRNGGLDVSTNLEGAIEIRTNTADVTVENGLFADNDGPGINVRNGSSVEVDYSTFVGNGFAGIAQTSGTVEVQYSVFRAQDDDIDGPVTNAFPNNPLENWYQHSSSLTDDCALVAPAVCYTGDPEFFTFHPEIPSDRWLLRPREFGPLWNGAGNIFGAGDVADIIGHAGGPEGDALTWYDDTEGAGTGDGLYDGWEFFWYGDLTTDQGTISSDEDGDNLYGFDEFALGTSPIHADTDQDGPDDHCEAFAAMPESDPVNPNDTTTFQCQ